MEVTVAKLEIALKGRVERRDLKRLEEQLREVCREQPGIISAWIGDIEQKDLKVIPAEP